MALPQFKRCEEERAAEEATTVDLRAGELVRIVGEDLLSLTRLAPPLCRFGHLEVPATAGGQGGMPALLSATLHARVALHDVARNEPGLLASIRAIAISVSPPPFSMPGRAFTTGGTCVSPCVMWFVLACRATTFGVCV